MRHSGLTNAEYDRFTEHSIGRYMAGLIRRDPELLFDPSRRQQRALRAWQDKQQGFWPYKSFMGGN